MGAGVGKSNLLLRFADDISPQYICTIGVDYRVRTIQHGGQRVKIQLWDTAGQERFKETTSAYYRGAHVILIVYDVTNRESFTNLGKHMKEVEKFTMGRGSTYQRLVLVGTNADLTERRQVSHLEGQEFADLNSMPFIETSAKCGNNVDKAFDAAMSEVFSHRAAMITSRDILGPLEARHPRHTQLQCHHPCCF